MWALLDRPGPVLCFPVAVAQTLYEIGSGPAATQPSENASVMAGILIVWSVLRAVSYSLAFGSALSNLLWRRATAER